MKKILLLGSLMLLSLVSSAASLKKVAILEVVDKEDKLSYVQKLMLRTTLAQSITNTAGYEAYSRTEVDAILNEQNFQRTGLVTDEDVKRLGAMAGADYILLPEGVVADNSNILVIATLLNVETGKMEIVESAVIGTSTNEMRQGCQTLANQLNNRLKLTNKEYLKEQNRIQQAKEEELKNEREKYKVVRVNAKKYSYLGSVMNADDYANLLQNNCHQAYKQFKTGKALIASGWASFAIGLVLVGGGVGSYFIAEEKYKSDYDDYQFWESMQQYGGYEGALDASRNGKEKYDTFHKLAIAGFAVGGALTVASIPLWIGGSSLKKKSVNTFNQNCAGNNGNMYSVNLTAGQNGLGLAFQF